MPPVQFVQDWVSQLREQVEDELMKSRTFNRRIAAIELMSFNEALLCLFELP